MDIIGDAEEPDPAGPVPRRSAVVRAADLSHALADGLIALGAAIVVAVLSLVIVIYSAGGHVQGGPVDFLVVAVWLTGASLGVPVHEIISTGIPGEGNLTDTAELRAVAWLLTGIILILVFRLVRRRERHRERELGHPVADRAQLAARTVLTALVVALVLFVLAFVTTVASVFGIAGLSEPGTHTSMGLEPGFVFAGPLLLTAAAAMAGAATAGAAPWRRRAADELERWRPVLRAAWRQALVTGVIAGITLLAYGTAEVSAHSNGREITVTIIGLVLLLPNLAIYGTLGGFGTTFYATLNTGGILQQPRSPGATHSIGIFGSIRPWIVWLLLGAAVAGVVVPALLARRAAHGERAARLGHVTGADYPLPGVWRAALTGLVTACAVIPLGSLSYTSSTSGIQGNSVDLTASAGANLFAAAGLTAAWLCVGYLATSLALRKPVSSQA